MLLNSKQRNTYTVFILINTLALRTQSVKPEKRTLKNRSTCGFFLKFLYKFAD